MIRLVIRTRRRGRRARPQRLRALLALGLALLVALAGGFLYVWVSVTQRFDGRLWQIPSRVYSDVETLRPGDAVSAGDVEARLERCGFARSSGTPAHPGQFRVHDGEVEIFLRAFASPVAEIGEQRVRLRFAGGILRSVSDADGRGLARVELEPELLATLYGPRQEERRPVALAAVPPRLIDAVLAAEDARFFRHPGIDLRGILRAGFANVRSGHIVQGGSTITQQTVKNLYLGQQRTWPRKIREAAMALVLDARYSKERILEVYLNEVYLGQRGPVAICGVQAASRFYFGKDVDDLSLGESATLAGLIRSPGRYNPFRHPGAARERRDQVLEAMLRLETIDELAADSARKERLELAAGPTGGSRAPFAMDFVRSRLSGRYPGRVLMDDGLEVYTTIDTTLQARARRVLRDGLDRLDRDRGKRRGEPLQGALLAIRPSSGAIVAMVGGRDYGATQFNRVVQARRQPGSCFKPFVYAAGFEQAVRHPGHGLTPASRLEDVPLEIPSGGKIWRPENYDRTFRGEVTARQALEESLNVPTVEAARKIGIERVIEMARRCGITSPLTPVPSLALGTEEVTPLELATAYTVFARGGERVDPWVLRAVRDAQGQRLEARAVERVPALDPEAAFQLNDVLEGVFQRGTARSAAALGFRGRAAGKTGTTDDTRDSWFVGYSGDLLALVWVGYDDNSRTGLTGATGALPIWTAFMAPDAADALPPALERPEGMVLRVVCAETGLLARRRCPETREEWFAAGSEPTRKCDLHVGRLRRWWGRVTGNDPG